MKKQIFKKLYQSIYLKDKKYQVATDAEKSRAKEIAKSLAGQYGYPQLKKGK